MQTMQIDPARLLELRQRKKLSRPQLAEMSEVNERTIQRLEKEPQPSRKKTLERLAKALGVKLDVLTGEEPLPESSKVPDSERVQIGAQIAPKARLAYDLIKRRYGVSATEIITMAPLFFALLAEGSLAWRREKLKELKEGIDRLKQIDGFWREYNVHLFALTVDNNDIETEEASIDKVDLFGEHLLGCATYDLDPSTDNPFASYLRQLKDELDIPGVVDVDSGHPMFGSPLRFPAYDICRDELDRIANNSDSVKDQKKKIKDLEKGMKDLEKEIKEKGEKIKEMVRTETYPEGVSEKEYLKLIGEAWKEEKEVWKELGHLGEKHMEEQSRLEMIIKEERDRITSLSDTIMYPEGDSKDIEEADSQKTNSNIEKGGDDQ
ncbi:MAG: helix-turn-helix transcriptional regulator [Gemmatimonadetes bacterium]|nr:helix-turn-helix transcriptional regulator [Gemmatimonadota bacterium]